MRDRLKRCWYSLNIAFSMYSRLPAMQCDWSQENMRYVMCFFPWIGLVIGALTLGWSELAGWLNLAGASLPGTLPSFLAGRLLEESAAAGSASASAPLRTLGLMLIPLAVTGGIHLDGLLDTADALSSWRPREKRLEILKDSHAGAFAVITGCTYFFALYAALGMLTRQMLPVYALGFVLSRSLSGFSVVTFPKASASGTVAGFAKDAQTRTIQAVSLCYLLLCAAGMLYWSPLYGAAALAAAALTFLWYHHMALKQFGGINGDLAGCFLSVCELAMPLAMEIAGLTGSRLFS